MILTCPNCATQYVVKDGAIPAGGRQVRCASCKHSWHQDPEASETPAAAEVEVAPLASNEPEAEAGPPADEADEGLAEASLVEPRSGPEAEERAYEEALIDERSAQASERFEEGGHSGDDIYAEAPFDIQRRDSEAPEEDWREPPGLEPQDDEFSP